jgi:diguanylate cyclase (GGDEF)-like protein/PAS domain S-box-containing protein
MALIDPGLALPLSLAGASMLALGGGALWLGMRRLDAARRILRKADAAQKDVAETRPDMDPWQYRFLEQVLDRIQDCVLVIDVDGRIVEANDAAARLFQRKPEELMGESLSNLVEPSIFEQEDQPQAEGNTRARTAAGDAIAVAFCTCPLTEPGGPSRWAVVLHNLSGEHRAQKRIRFLARYDMLTRIPNRMEFQHRLQQATARALRSRTRAALLYIDLDKFKDVNDRLGHPIGDRALEIMSRRLVDGMDSGTLTGRLGGDEFGLLLEGLPAAEDPRPAVASVTRDLLDSMSQKFHVEGYELLLTSSIGVAVFPDDADNVIDLIRNADAAMYHAKQNGGNTYGFYSPDMNADAVDRLLLKNELRSAIQRNEFELLYQPKVDLRDGRIAGCEALLRWRHSRRGDVPPTLFIPLAEENTLIFEIGEWVLETVCRDFTAWQQHVPWPGRVALNLSLRQLRQPNFADGVEQLFRRHQLTPSCVELEITESTLADHGEQTLRTLDRLYELGLHLSIDDFGTGYSSLSSLQHFPIGTLKIDRSFIENAGEKHNSTAIVGAIVGLGRSLGMDVVAEGVETMEQLALLQRIGCTYGQGHLFGAPVSGERYLEMLVEQQEGQAPHAALLNMG